MPEIQLDGSAEMHAIGGGYRIAVPEIVGALRSGDARGERSRGFFEDQLDSLLEDAGLERDKVIHIVAASPSAPGTRGFAETPTPTLSLDVPRDEDSGALVLLEDAYGAVSWHLPVTSGSRSVKSRAGAPAAIRFEIPLPVVDPDGSARAFGLPNIGGAILKVFTYPLRKIVRGFIRKWEEKNRPYRVRSYVPESYTDARRDFPALDAAGWAQLAEGRALLFVHGTFSSAAAFNELPLGVMNALSQQYGGRLFAFNHFTMTDDPATNAARFFDMMPDDVSLEVDIICHSRGGLVARELAARGASGRLKVGKIVFVAATNAGTTLADKEHLIALFNRFTTFAKLLPGPAGRVVDALAVGLQALGKTLLSDELGGLAAMDPQGPYLVGLNVPGGLAVNAYALASNFEPKRGTPWFSLTRAADVTIDAVFGRSPNDLVVPRDGAFTGVNAAGFPIPPDRVEMFGELGGDGGNEGVIHTQFFIESRTHAALLKWLTPARALTRAAAALSVPELESLRPHVINLSGGRLRSGGKYSTSPADVDDIFAVHIPAWMKAGGGGGGPLRIVLWAHGGLINEQDGLAIARKHIEWWKANGVYPVYFAWETGLFDALRSILESLARQLPGVGRRGFVDDLTDKVIEKGARALGGPKIWQAMKTNAMLCSEPKGGAFYAATRLEEFCRKHPGTELHAVGHSAGAIFHSYFLPAAQTMGTPGFASLQLLAPAIRIDAFVARLVPIVGPALHVRTARMLTMTDTFEKDDTCIGIYRKSLLYLIRQALESKTGTPILGLERDIADNPSMRRFFTPASGGPASAIWSVTSRSAPPSASSRSTTHGGFDDDSATMSSVVAHVLSAAAAKVPYPGSRAIRDEWPMAREWMRDFDRVAPVSLGRDDGPTDGDGMADPAIVPRRPAPIAPGRAPATPATPAIIVSGGRRTVLCIGIDEYRGHELAGCVADARAWHKTFEELDFKTTLLTNGQGTAEGILDGMRKLVGDARAGDVLAFQFAGHGYKLPDLDGDEEDETDEALVPFDFQDGAFVLDDDIFRALSGITPGVSLTVFMDNCNSGTNTRLFSRRGDENEEVARIRQTGKARFLKTDRTERDALEAAHEAYRADSRNTRTLSRGTLVSREDLRWVNFSACTANEEALEHDGRGDFSKKALEALVARTGPLTNDQFHRIVVERFGAHRAQTPVLDCSTADESLPFLGGILRT